MGNLTIMAAAVLIAASVLALAWTVERRGRRDEARAGELAAAAEREALRLRLLERRLAVHARLDALWLCWARRGRPDTALLGEAAAAAEEAKLLFAPEHEAELAEAGRLLVALERSRQWQEEALNRGRSAESDELRERQAEIESALLAAVERLRGRLGDETRSSALAA